MPKTDPTINLTTRYLAAGAGFKPEEQFFALLNAASHVHAKRGEMTDPEWNKIFAKPLEKFYNLLSPDEQHVLEELPEDNAPF